MKTILPVVTVFVLILSACAELPVDSNVDNASSSDESAARRRRPRRASSDSTGINGCTNRLADNLGLGFGRMDGRLFAVVPPTAPRGECNADASHYHLQLDLGNGIYDVAVNSKGDVVAHEVTAPLKGPNWRQGWHEINRLDYADDLGVGSDDFDDATMDEFVRVIGEAQELSVYGMPYSDGTGAHWIHRSHRAPEGDDGALVINPNSDNPRWFLFRFGGQSF